MNKHKLKKCLLTIIIFISCNKVYATETFKVINQGDSFNSSNPCGNGMNGYIACYSPKFQFRATLVDKNGKKVSGTNSVDFGLVEKTSSGARSKIKVYDKAQGKYEMKVKDYIDYEYKYQDINLDKENQTPKYIEMEVDLEDSKNLKGHKNQKDIDQPDNFKEIYEKFTNQYLENYSYAAVEFGDNNKYADSFLGAFLYYAGYAPYINIKSQDTTYSHPISTTEFKSVRQELQNYYIIIEPTYLIYFNTSPNDTRWQYLYGTSTELLTFLYKETAGSITIDGFNYNGLDSNVYSFNPTYSEGYLVGLTREFIRVTACNLSTIPDNVPFITISTDCNVDTGLPKKLEGNPPWWYRRWAMDEAINPKAGYGVAWIELNLEEKNTNQPLKYVEDICKEESNGKLSLRLETNNTGGVEYTKINPFFEAISSTAKDKKPTQYYTNISFDFSSVMKQFGGELPTNQIIEIPNGIATTEFITINSSEKLTPINLPKQITVNILGQEVIFTKSMATNIEWDDMKSKKIGLFGTVISTKYTTEYIPNKKAIKINANNSNKNVLVDFSNIDFKKITEGTATGDLFKKYGYNNSQIQINDVIYNYSFEKSGNLNSCKVTPSLKSSAGYIFRTIDLNNPFPARDGTSRLPGINWLNSTNYVYNVITNSRGIQYHKYNNIQPDITYDPNLMYTELQPIYTITLTPSLMRKIRQYNKENNYSNINLECDQEGRQCISTFLRDDIFKDSISGACYLTKQESQKPAYDLNDNKYQTTAILHKFLYENDDKNKPYEYRPYDFNKNGFLDTEDYELFLNLEKNTKYYDCASKSYKTGGQTLGGDN